MRLIDADKVKQYALTKGFYCDTDADKEATAEEIDQLFPTVDAVEVVRCKDCKWWKLSEYNTCGIHICQRFSGVRGEHDFCSRSERRENETR